jgi:hypothetical protein
VAVEVGEGEVVGLVAELDREVRVDRLHSRFVRELRSKGG